MVVSAKIAILMFMIISIFSISLGAVYKVGDDSGWHPSFDYQKWASSKKFFVGDTIRFEYNNSFHNVNEITEPNYVACNATSPIETHSTGNDSFTLTLPGHRYFLCGFPNHCLNGQKVDINANQVPSPIPRPVAPTPGEHLPSTPAPAPTEYVPWAPAPNPAEYLPWAPAPAPTSDSSYTLYISHHQIAINFLAMVLLAYFI